MSLALANGQLGASSATILGVATGERTVKVTLYNTGSIGQTIILTMARDGGTARTIFRAVMARFETCELAGVQLDPSDVLAGYATGAGAVDYDVTRYVGSFGIFARDENGAPKASKDITVTTTEKFGLTRDGIVIAGLLEEVRDLLAKIA